MTPSFADRRAAGQELARSLTHLAARTPIVLALPRGGVPVAAEVARALAAPLDVLVVRKIGLPENPEYGIGALALTDTPLLVVDDERLARHGLNRAALAEVIAAETAEARRRQQRYRGARPLPDLNGRCVILVDDGLATGSTARAALRAARAARAGHLVLAVPVGAPDSIAGLAGECDEIICPHQPFLFGAVGAFYRDFGQTSDEEVIALLADARQAHDKANGRNG